MTVRDADPTVFRRTWYENFAFRGFSEDEMRRPTPYAVP
jgi:hypothetical protein